ncbi:MAG: nuclear transport factor 2 family protein [Waddliaceae bacterium]
MRRIMMWPLLILPLTLMLSGCGGEGNNEDSNKVRKKASEYADAFNRQDSQALAAQWTEEAIYVNPLTGSTVQGRDAIEDQFNNVFKELGNAELSLTIESIDFPDANTAIEKGIAKLMVLGKDPTETDYKVAYKKQNGEWLISRISEIDLFDPPTHYDQLQLLDWLVGEWIDQDEDVQIISRYAWDAYKNFLTQKFTINVHGKKDIDGRQIIGWDPANEEIRSWVFDSAGGFGEGVWKKQGDNWLVELAYTLPDGRPASAVNIYKQINDHTYSFESTGREVDGEMLPNISPVKVVKQKG